MSSLVLSPNSSMTEVRNLVNEKKCTRNVLCFTENVFTMVNDKLTFCTAFSDEKLKKYFAKKISGIDIESVLEACRSVN